MTHLAKERHQTKKAVTLVELLVVVAIIAILASIGTINFLQMQTRAKVSRAKGEMRTLLVGVAGYVVDHGQWFDAEASDPVLGQRAFQRLTSPIAYLSPIPADPFYRKGEPESNDPPFPTYAYMNMFQLHRMGLIEVEETWEEGFFIVSRGPDGDFDANDVINGELLHGSVAYDPDNGTVSNGDLFLGYAGFDEYDDPQDEEDE